MAQKKRKILVIFYGLPGTGKTTACKLFAKKLRDCYFFDSDEYGKKTDFFRGIDFGSSSDEALQRRRMEFYMAKADIIGNLIEGNACVALASGCDRKEYREILYSTAHRYHTGIMMVEVACPDNVAKKRMMENKGHVSSPEKRWELYQRMKQSFQPIGLLEKWRHAIITGSIRSEFEVASQIDELIRKRSLEEI
ncbi:AAA family ATPase [Candidatus Woesearchaeota archaeon]|nr:AAA family ATPase [Candidatus Woesearchaeota archaeon]